MDEVNVSLCRPGGPNSSLLISISIENTYYFRPRGEAERIADCLGQQLANGEECILLSLDGVSHTLPEEIARCMLRDLCRVILLT